MAPVHQNVDCQTSSKVSGATQDQHNLKPKQEPQDSHKLCSITWIILSGQANIEFEATFVFVFLIVYNEFVFELLSCVFRSRRSWLLFRKSAPTGSNTCWTVRREKSTPSIWRAFVWVSITWVLWTTLKMTTDETRTLHHPPSVLLVHFSLFCCCFFWNQSAVFATDSPVNPLGWCLHRPYTFLDTSRDNMLDYVLQLSLFIYEYCIRDD